MNKCPKCGEEIRFLNYSCLTPETGVYLTDEGYLDIEHFDMMELEFSCPICQKTLFTESESADKFLEG
jgi:hypothetical protein